MVFSSERWGLTLFAIAILSSLGLCLPGMRGQPLTLDEHVSYFSAGAPSLGELWARTVEDTVLPPLTHLIERAALGLGGKSETVFRAPSLMAYVVAILIAFGLGRCAGGPICGGLTSLIVAWHPGVLENV